MCQFGFRELKLHRIEAGVYACNIGSQKALEANRFEKEGVFKEHIIFKGAYMDVYRYALINKR